MAITKMELHQYARPLVTFIDRDGDLDLDAPYQRGHVWGEARQRALIESILDGTPIPAIIMNNRFGAKFHEEGYDQERNWSFAVIDGKQRVTAIQSFVNDKFTIPAEWIAKKYISDEAKDKTDVVYSDLTLPFHRGFQMNTIPVAEGQFSTLEEEKRVFDRVNFGGVAQGESDF
jgi:hypothetical protein